MASGGTEHLKERVSEYMSSKHNPERAMGSKFSPSLTGNWNEDRFDSKFVATGGKRSALPTELDHSWKSHYAEQNAQAETRVAPRDPQLTATTQQLLQTLSGRNPAGELSQPRLVDVVDGRFRAYPGHQPELDATQTAGPTPLVTEAHDQFVEPGAQRLKKAVNAKDLFAGPGHDKPGFVVFKIRNALQQLPVPASAPPPGPKGADKHVERKYSFPALRRCLLAAERRPPVPTIRKLDGRLTQQELGNGLRDYGVPVDAAELTALFKSLDPNITGEVPAVLVVQKVRGAMNDRRRGVVVKAFELIEAVVARRQGIVAGRTRATPAFRMSVLLELFDASAHPSAVGGHQAPDDIRRAFFEEFHQDARREEERLADIVTKERFVELYEDWSALVAEDHYFEKAVRDTWHVSGGTGLAMNTSCRRVEVTHTNGRVTKQEILNDLAIAEGDDELMRANLAKQGINDVKRIAFARSK